MRLAPLIFLTACATTRPATMTDTWSYALSDQNCVDRNVGPAIHACREQLWRDTCAQLDPPCLIPEPGKP